MSRNITLILDEDTDVQDVLAVVCKIDGVEVHDGSDALSMVAQIARMETWEERCARKAVEDKGLTDPAAIERHIFNAVAEVDYFVVQDEALEGLIQSARRIRGALQSRAEIIAKAIETYAKPGESDLEP